MFPKISGNKRGKIRVPQIFAAFSGFPTFPWICSISAFDENLARKASQRKSTETPWKGAITFGLNHQKLCGPKNDDSPKKRTASSPLKFVLLEASVPFLFGFQPMFRGKLFVFWKCTYCLPSGFFKRCAANFHNHLIFGLFTTKIIHVIYLSFYLYTLINCIDYILYIYILWIHKQLF